MLKFLTFIGVASWGAGLTMFFDGFIPLLDTGEFSWRIVVGMGLIVIGFVALPGLINDSKTQKRLRTFENLEKKNQAEDAISASRKLLVQKQKHLEVANSYLDKTRAAILTEEIAVETRNIEKNQALLDALK